MTDYRGKKVVIIGLGLTGTSCLDFFLSRGVTPRIMDSRFIPVKLKQYPENIKYCTGSLNQKWLINADLIVVSPGISLSHPCFKRAIEAGIEIIGDIEIFCREVKAPIVAITGSNGKSTVTSMIAKIAQEACWSYGVGGNIGVPVLRLLNKAPAKLYIIELSSFQLETTRSLHATAASILNITKDHMNRYPLGIEQYRLAKLRIYENARFCIVNADDTMTIPLSGLDQRCITFGVHRGDYNLKQYQENIWLTVKGKAVLNTKKMYLIGEHNYTNALATLALADAIGLPRKISIKVLTTFAGLPHRFQVVFNHNGVLWINDSKATNVASTEAALNGLKVKGKLHLLLGGDGKYADFSPLKKYLKNKNIKLWCFGRDRARLAALRPEVAVQTLNMAEAIHQIKMQLQLGDVVLLSPACASFDQFKNFEDRGNAFIRMAKEGH